MSSLKMTGKTAAVMITAVMCLAQGVLAQTQTWNCGPNGSASVKATYNNGTLTISGTGDMVEDVYYLPNEAWQKNYQNLITTVVIENGVTSIADEAFYQCENLIAVTIGENVTSIGHQAFYGCENLSDVTIGENVTSIGMGAFGESGLTTLTIPNSVISIGDEAFSFCPNLTTVTIGENVASIGVYVFSTCENLNSINVAQTNESYSSEDGVLFDKMKTSLIQYPNGRAGAYKIPNGVIEIGHAAFAGHIGLTFVTIPNSVKTIGDEAFSSCNGLTVIDIPNSVTEIGRQAFLHSALTAAIIGDGVVSIGNHAFSSCSGLTSVTIGNSVTTIGDNVFYGCSKLKDINVFAITPPTVSNNAFEIWMGDMYSSANLYVPQGSLADYQAAPVWKDFVNMSEVVLFTVTFDPQDGTTFEQSVISGDLVSEPAAPARAGYAFGGWYKESAYITEWDFEADEVDEDITLYAKWDIINYTVTWNTNGGLPVPTQTTATIESGITVPAAMTKDEYDFKGWYTDAAFMQAATFPMSNVTENKTFYAKWESNTSVISRDRTPVPPSGNVPLLSVVLAGEFAVGPNPVAKSEGKMNFFWQGGQLENATLFIYDASGSLVKKIAIADKSKTRTDKRAVGTWDLKDAKGRAASEGSYVVKGAIKTKDGKKEKISLVVGVR